MPSISAPPATHTYQQQWRYNWEAWNSDWDLENVSCFLQSLLAHCMLFSASSHILPRWGVNILLCPKNEWVTAADYNIWEWLENVILESAEFKSRNCTDLRFYICKDIKMHNRWHLRWLNLWFLSETLSDVVKFDFSIWLHRVVFSCTL
jgi:hypothetical protein